MSADSTPPVTPPEVEEAMEELLGLGDDRHIREHQPKRLANTLALIVETKQVIRDAIAAARAEGRREGLKDMANDAARSPDDFVRLIREIDNGQWD